MRSEIAPIVEEDKNPDKIRKALRQGCGGVLVSHKIPDEVLQEWAGVKDGPLGCASDYSEYLYIPKEGGGVRWTCTDEKFQNLRAWLKEEFQWAVSARLCRNPQTPQTRQTMMHVWMNNAQALPWHIDNAVSEIYPDIHLQIAGPGMLVANPPLPMKMNFSEAKSSPHLQLPESDSIRAPARKMNDDAPQKTLDQKLTAYLQQRQIALIKLAPGQVLFFNEKCLHRSASACAPRLRAVIF